MAKHPMNSGKERSAYPAGTPGSLLPPLRRRRLRWGAVVAAVVLVAYVAAAYLLFPAELPWLQQRLLGAGCVALAVLVFALATRHAESTEELLFRLRRGQHSDFGKRRRLAQKQQRTIRLPVLGETSYRPFGGFGVLVLGAAWWLSPWAPVVVKEYVIEDLTVPLGEEIAAVVLVMPNAQMAIAQVPVVPLRARQLAELIDENTSSYHRGLKAIAQGRFGEARRLLATAMKDDDAEPLQIHLARAQNEMYAGQFLDAVGWYKNAVGRKPDDPKLLCQMAVAWMQAGKFDRAEPVVARAVKACRQKLAEDGPAVAACLHVQAALNVGLGRQYDEAEQMCWQARGIFEEAFGRQHPLVAATLNNQAVLYLLQAKYPGAASLFSRARDIWVRTLGPQHPHVTTSLTNLAMLHYNPGQYGKAGELLQRALPIYSKSLQETSPILATTCNANALLDVTLARDQQSQQLAEKALVVSEKAFGPQHPSLAPILDTLAAFYTEAARYTKAELYYLRALAVIRKVWGPEHSYLVETLNHLACLHIAQGRYQEAESLCEQALEIAKKSLGEKHLGTAAVLNTRGRLEIERSQLRKARPYLEEALRIRREVFGREHPDVARTMGNLAALDNSPRTYGHGVSRYKKAIEMSEKLLGADHPQVAHLWYGLAALHAHRGKYPEAESCLKRALEIREKALVPYHPDLAATLDAHASLLLKITPPEPGRAAAMQTRAKSILAKHAEEDRPE